MKDKIKNKPRTIFWVLIVVLAFFLHAYILYMSLPWVLMAGHSLLSDEKPPEIIYEEFPVELTYTKNGEVITAKAIYVAEYKGWIPTTGRKWNGYIKETGESGMVIHSEDKTKIICMLGSPEYFMGDHYFEDPSVPHVIKEEKAFLKKEETALSQQELLEQYNIEIISWEIAEPVQNSFD